ncbi:MAG: chromate transporter [Clostridia bacterium]|nr:chromate transporter [Clostridia bacterium]
MIFLQLFWEFFKTGLFAVGGGMATVPFLYDMGERMGWFTDAQLADMIAVADSTPGPIGVNMATYVGYTSVSEALNSTLMGVFGALVATFSLVLPSVIVVLIVAKVLKAFKDNFYVKSAFYGLRPASTGLITAAGCTVAAIALLNIDLFKETGKFLDVLNIPALILAAVLIVLTNVKGIKKLHPVVFIAFSAIVGIVFKFGA